MSLNEWYDSCDKSKLLEITIESCKSKLTEIKQLTESLNISIQEGQQLDNYRQDRINELYIFYKI